MVFSTPVFVYGFLPLTLALYYIVPRRLRNAVLLFSSLLFYFWGERLYTVIMLLSTVIDYTHGLLVERCKARGNDRGARRAVASSVIFNLALLGFFKYWDFLAGSLQSVGLTFLPVLGVHLPIGISFYTFQTMSYTIDVYRGDARAQRSILNFGTFVTLFPQLIAGPIIKYKDLGDQIDERTCSAEKFASGAQVFTVGLAKKLLLSNNFAQLWEVYRTADPASLTVTGAWLGALAFVFHDYFDFSGYSDMAIGLGRMLGFEFKANFNYPFISRSVTEFWRRWHISLTTWLREYLYYPLGGSRCSKPRWMLNLLLVWAATGLWHGASWNYLLWGVSLFAVQMLEKLFLGKWLEKLPAPLASVYAVLMFALTCVIFSIEDLAHQRAYFAAMFGFGGAAMFDAGTGYYLTSFLPSFAVAIVGSTPAPAALYRRLPEKARAVTGTLLLLAGLAVCTAYLVAGTFNPFLYFRF